MSSQSANPIPSALRWASALALAGSCLVGVSAALAHWLETLRAVSFFAGLQSLGLWAALGCGLFIVLRGRESHWYWLYLTVMLPMVLGGGALAVGMGAKWGFPVTGSWISDMALLIAIGLHGCAGVLLARKVSRPVTAVDGGALGGVSPNHAMDGQSRD